MCDGTEQNLLNPTCDGIRFQRKRQAIQQPCRDVAVTCVGMFIYKNTYWVYLIVSPMGVMLEGQHMYSQQFCYIRASHRYGGKGRKNLSGLNFHKF